MVSFFGGGETLLPWGRLCAPLIIFQLRPPPLDGWGGEWDLGEVWAGGGGVCVGLGGIGWWLVGELTFPLTGRECIRCRRNISHMSAPPKLHPSTPKSHPNQTPSIPHPTPPKPHRLPSEFPLGLPSTGIAHHFFGS